MLNSAEHEIYPANKSQITYNCNFFLAKDTEHEHFSANKYEIANYYWHLRWGFTAQSTQWGHVERGQFT